jgi:hypothetical protein
MCGSRLYVLHPCHSLAAKTPLDRCYACKTLAQAGYNNSRYIFQKDLLKDRSSELRHVMRCT